MESLADFLRLGAALPDPVPEAPLPAFESLADVSDPVKFCQGIVSSREFRQYILAGVMSGPGKDGLPPAVMCRIMDHAWGKPPERVEHTGKNGEPIVSEVRRVIVRTVRMSDDEDEIKQAPVTH